MAAIARDLAPVPDGIDDLKREVLYVNSAEEGLRAAEEMSSQLVLLMLATKSARLLMSGLRMGPA